MSETLKKFEDDCRAYYGWGERETFNDRAWTQVNRALRRRYGRVAVQKHWPAIHQILIRSELKYARGRAKWQLAESTKIRWEK